MLKTLKPFGSGSPPNVDAFERRNHLSLPDDYRKFLVEYNGGQLYATACFIKDLNDSVLVDVLLGVDQQERTFSSEFWLSRFCQEMPPGFVIIALGATGMFILGTDGPDRGVYFWDDANAFEGSSEEAGNTYRVAATFTEFIDSLVFLE